MFTRQRAMATTAGKAALILIATLVTYMPAMSAGFIWDDGQLLIQNPLIHDPAGIWKVWLAPAAADSFPLTASVLWIEYHLGGFFDLWNVGFLLRHAADGAVNGYHVVNILLHGIAAVLMWRVLRVLRVPGAWLAALIFAVHPVCVESVAWVSELKNTLSHVFFVLTLLAYFHFEANRRAALYVCAVAAFCLSLAAKPSVVPLPAVLLLAAWWQRGTITWRDVTRSLPFFAASCIAGIVAVALQSGSAMDADVIAIGGPGSRVANAGMAVWFYLSKVVCPLHLIPIYPAWKVTPPAWYEFLPAVALVAVVVGCWRWRARAWARTGLAALGYYTIMLLPALGLVKMSYMRLTVVADHFQYHAMMSVIALVVAAPLRWLPRRAWTLFAAVVVVTLCSLSWTQAAMYRNEETLWTETLKRNPESWQAHNLLGVALWKKGDPTSTAEAFEHFRRAVELNPENPEVHNNLGLGYATRGQMDPAIEEYKKAIRIRDDAAIRTNLGNALCAVQRYAEAEEEYRTAASMDPGNPARYVNLGYALMQQDRLDEASEQFRQALHIDPNLAQPRQYLSAIANRQAQNPH